jgi:hypothetical protein
VRTISSSMQIGVTGHRQPPKLPNDALVPVRGSVAAIIAALDTLCPTRRRAVSSLAEGADCIVAEAALAAGWQLSAILPFAQAEYERDFATPGSLAVFRQLLKKTDAVVQLPGLTSDHPRAYEAAGLAMLENLDLLIAIWDGKPAAGTGGSADIVAAALERHIPVAWINPVSPGDIRLSNSLRQSSGSFLQTFVSVTPNEIARALARP